MIATLAVSNWILGVLLLVFLIVCALLILTVLIQKPQGGGLSAAFGASSGSGQTAFGTKTGDALTVFTIIIFVAYLGIAVGLNYATRPPKASPGEPTIQTPEGTLPADSTTDQPASDGANPGNPSPVTTPPTGQPTDTPPVESPAQPAQPDGAAPAAPSPAPISPQPAPVAPSPATPPKGE